MTVKQFRRNARRKRQDIIIPTDKIRMVSEVHIRADIPNEEELQKSLDKLLVIVHKNDDGTYNLITGWKDYVIAVKNDIKKINAIPVKETNRDDFLCDLSKEFRNINELIVPKDFKNRPPRQEKLNTYIRQVKYAIEKHRLYDYLNEKPVTVDKDNVILDGYTRYLALKSIGYNQDIPVRKV